MDEFRISVVGLGRLGLPLAAVLANCGFKVVGIDKDRDVVETVNAGKVPNRIWEPGLQELLDSSGSLIATSDMGVAAYTQTTILLVPTPSEPNGAFSLSYVLEACVSLGEVLKGRTKHHTVIVGSTVMPGACGGAIQKTLEETSGRKVGDDLGLCYCPEFVALGNVIRGFLEPDFVLIGASDVQADFSATEIYGRLCLNDPPVAHISLINAELAKIALNCYITTKITFANQLAELCEQIPGADADEITETIGLDSRIGLRYLIGAIAFGGPCFPRDVRSFTCVARRVGVELPLLASIDGINKWQTRRLAELVQSHWERTRAKKIGILGLAYKPGTNVAEESAGMALVELLIPSENVIAFDPVVQIGQSAKTAQICADATDIIVVVTPWPEFGDVRFHKGQVVIDCWRMLDQSVVEGAGAEYIAIGRGE